MAYVPKQSHIKQSFSKFYLFFPPFPLGLASITMLYNLLNFPAGAVPVSTVTSQDEEDLKDFRGNYQDTWDKLHKQVILCLLGQAIAF